MTWGRSPLPWLVRDTFRQSLASGIFWLMLGVTALCVAACLTATEVPAPEEAPDAVRLVPRDRFAAARSVASVVSGGFAQSHGVWPVPGPFYSPAYRKAAVQAMRPLAPTSYFEIAFGAVRIPVHGDRERGVRGLQLQLAAWVADAVGLLLALTWTASFLPTFLEAGAVVVLLAKPIAR
jgi:hypothetical protein